LTVSGKSETKLTKYHVLRRDSGLARALPRTRLLSKETMVKFLEKYPKVIAKPIAGSGGAGVMLISSLKDNRYQVHHGKKRRTIKGKIGTYRYVRGRIKTRYIVQQGISLARVHNRPIDVRVMVQRHKGGPWRVTGMLAKVAGPGYIITNIKRSGGKVLPLSTAIRLSNARHISASSIIRKLESTALRAAKRLATYYTGQRVFGFDMAVDSGGKVWIIEANLRPDITLFLKLKDRSMYRRIVAYRRKGRE
jgi:uncharacterized circularly permuted ATP-grasp superfamily protein